MKNAQQAAAAAADVVITVAAAAVAVAVEVAAAAVVVADVVAINRFNFSSEVRISGLAFSVYAVKFLAI
ncbi:MAG: hypothetical protein JWN25_2226 [Verrucomicrobiales bacterium]|nr:hypothetical protein [Verrucomicrobiales bacterium]